MGKYIQKIITNALIQRYPKIKRVNFLRSLYPISMATAPSKDPCGMPIKETMNKAAKDKKLSSSIYTHYSKHTFNKRHFGHGQNYLYFCFKVRNPHHKRGKL